MSKPNMYKRIRTNLLLLLLLLLETSCSTLEVEDPLPVHPDDEGDEPGALVRGRITGGDAFSPGGQVIDDELSDDLRVRTEGHPRTAPPLAKCFLLLDEQEPFHPFSVSFKESSDPLVSLRSTSGLVCQPSLILSLDPETFLPSRDGRLSSNSFPSFGNVVGEASHLLDATFRLSRLLRHLYMKIAK